MNTTNSLEHNVIEALQNFEHPPLRDAAIKFLNTLGYHSKRISTQARDRRLRDTLKAEVEASGTRSDKRDINDWQDFHILFQITDDEVDLQDTWFQGSAIDLDLMDSYVFAALALTGDTYSRTQLANITRFINKKIEQPIMVIFRYSHFLSLAIINRREHKQAKGKKVLEKVTLIKDINLNKPHAAHRNILAELSLERLIEIEGVHNFDTLHKAWAGILDTEPLSREFYGKLYKWYQWAVDECQFSDNDKELQIIRLITRLLFVWFLVEKHLVPVDLFENDSAKEYLNRFDLETSDYYQAVLQNLFFATLNTPINERRFVTDAGTYHYADLLKSRNTFLKHLKSVPFVNGGLFDYHTTQECFTDDPNERQALHVPAKLFFEAEKGIFPIFSHYKFTVEENTPVEQEVALDPELLGQVFENLLGVYNPETQTTARRATGSYYTPRKIVEYMVDEALVAYFLQKVKPYDGDREYLEDRLRLELEELLAYESGSTPGDHLIDEDELEKMIDAIYELKVIDPAVGSGAFPMDILNKLVLILQKLDPQNERWKQRQLKQVSQILDPESKRSAIHAIEEVFSEANYHNNYGRKLYLIQNCIYGVDIQPFAITIAKLRFFISLVIEQKSNKSSDDNYGIHPLPNLETKLVAANTLIGLKKLHETETLSLLEDNMVQPLLLQIQELRVNYFDVNTLKGKQEHIEKEEGLRNLLDRTLDIQYEAWCVQEQNRIREQVAQLPTGAARQQHHEELQRKYKIREAKVNEGVAEAKRIAQWDAYDPNAVARFFEAKYMFGVKDGFDIVIGNPPYGAKISGADLKLIKTNIQDTRNSNSAALFIDICKNHVMKSDGTLAFIVPKSLLYSEKWQNLAYILSEKAKVLVDVEQAFKNVLLEQVVFVYGTWCETEHYTARKFVRGKFTQTTQISKTYPKIFEAWICDVSSDEIQLGLKLNCTGIPLSDISVSKRGLSIQKFLQATGDVKVIGGRNISRYGIDGLKGFVTSDTLASADNKIQSLLQPKIISQNIVTAKKINATVDKKGEILGVDTVENTFLTNQNFSLNFIASLFNSTLINWYAHRFIFCAAQLTMHFDNYYVGKIPIPRVTTEDQQPVIELVERISSAKQENPQADSTEAERQIDKFVYALYGLTDTEVALVEKVMGGKG